MARLFPPPVFDLLQKILQNRSIEYKLSVQLTSFHWSHCLTRCGVLVCKDFSHGQPDVLHLSSMVKKLFTLRREGGGGGGEEGGEGRESRRSCAFFWSVGNYILLKTWELIHFTTDTEQFQFQ